MIRTRVATIDTTYTAPLGQSARVLDRKRKRPNRRSACALTGALSISIPLAIVLVCRTICSSDGSTDAGQAFLRCECWALVVVGITGTTMASRGIRWGWLLLFGLQPLWIAYAISTAQHGLVLASLAYGAAQLSGFLRAESRKDA